MPSLGPAEILVILVVALLVFGPNKMPDVARQAGKAFAEFRRVQQHLRNEIKGAVADLNPSDGNGSSAADASNTMGGGDPVPMLPPKDPPPADPAEPNDATAPNDGPNDGQADGPSSHQAPTPPPAEPS